MWMKPLLSKQDKIKSGVEPLIAAGNVQVLVLRPRFFFRCSYRYLLTKFVYVDHPLDKYYT